MLENNWAPFIIYYYIFLMINIASIRWKFSCYFSSMVDICNQFRCAMSVTQFLSLCNHLLFSRFSFSNTDDAGLMSIYLWFYLFVLHLWPIREGVLREYFHVILLFYKFCLIYLYIISCAILPLFVLNVPILLNYKTEQ